MDKITRPDELDSLRIIRGYLVDHKARLSGLTKTNYDDYILSISDALHNVQLLLRQHNMADNKIENLTDLISLEALKQGMIIHFDKGKRIG